MTVVAVPIYPLDPIRERSPEGEPTMEEAARILNEVLANIAKQPAELAEIGVENYSAMVADHLLTILDCWYQARTDFSDGYYRRAIGAAEGAQTIIDDTPYMISHFPVPFVPDHIWGNDAKEGPIT
jgi:hypothetical protein